MTCGKRSCCSSRQCVGTVGATGATGPRILSGIENFSFSWAATVDQQLALPAVDQIIIWNFNVLSNSSMTPTNTFTIPQSGVWQFFAQVGYRNNPATSEQVEIQYVTKMIFTSLQTICQPTSRATIFDDGPEESAYSANLTGKVRLNIGDKVQITGAINTLFGNLSESFIAGGSGNGYVLFSGGLVSI